MKLTPTHTTKRKAGMTLLELTVVILVLLSLIAILFVGARAWKKGSDRSANIMNIRNTQQAMRGHENMFGLEPNVGVFTEVELEDYMNMPSPVASVSYGPGATITPQSETPIALTTAHIWVVVTGPGMPTEEYGHAEIADVTGW